jgi:hypothetical protein
MVTIHSGSTIVQPGVNSGHCQRNFSFFASKSNINNQLIGPVYQIYGEETCWSIRVIPPEFRSLASGKIVLNNNSRGRLLLQWSPRGVDGKYDYDHSIRFALSAEEAATVFLVRLDPQSIQFLSAVAQRYMDESIQPSSAALTAEIVRRPNTSNALASIDGTAIVNDDIPDKVFRAKLNADGSVVLTVDFERDGIGGQETLASNETVSVLVAGAQPKRKCARVNYLYSHIILFVFRYLLTTERTTEGRFDVG